MAQLKDDPVMRSGAVATNTSSWTTQHTRAQWRAVAWLRWRILVNSVSRKGKGGEVIARLLVYPILLGMLFLPAVGAGMGVFYFLQTGHLERLSWLFWGTFLLAQFTNINLGTPGTTFDPNQLIRFPLSLRSFVFLRLFFGVLSPANLLVALMCAAMALGFGIAMPRLWLFGLIAMAVFAAVNIFFSRMLFAWVDRWLSTRRAREIFTALIFVGSLGFQYLNMSLNTGYTRRHAQTANVERWHAVGRAYTHAQPALALLPPELTAGSLRNAVYNKRLAFTLQTVACALYGAFFLGVFAVRMRTEFRGEALSDQAIGGSASTRSSRPQAGTAVRLEEPHPRRQFLSPTIRAVYAKELLYTRRNTGVLYSLIAPLAMVFIFAGRMATRHSTPWIFPACLAYTLMGVLPLTYNSFGLEGPGVQFYFLAPVRFRDIVLAKNLQGFSLAVVEMLATVVAVTVVVGPPTTAQVLPSVLWAAAVLLTSASLGNLRSLAAPRQIKLSKASGKQASPLSALMSFGVLLLTAAVGACILVLARVYHLSWLPVVTFTTLLAGAVALYTAVLRHIDRYALDHREDLFAELCKS